MRGESSSKARQQISVQSDQSGLHRGRADVNADRDRVRMSCRLSFAHNDSELYSRRSFASFPQATGINLIRDHKKLRRIRW